jgi:Ser/Thr protein kinase RdoA (MazF antagonist)
MFKSGFPFGVFLRSCSISLPVSTDPFDVLQTPAPSFSIQQAAALLRDHYDIQAALEPLVSERDQNFLVSVADGTKYVLKFANSAEAPEITDFQTRALLHIARADPAIPVPAVIPTRNDQLLFDATSDTGAVHRVRLLSWLDGTPLCDADEVVSIAAQMGSCLARLGLALKDFTHPASDYALLWDIRNTSHLIELLPHIRDAGLRQLCEEQVGHFRESVEPQLHTLRIQVIYNDMNSGNVLVDSGDASRLAGVIDFGDIARTQLVNDVAIAAAYLCTVDDDPYVKVIDFLSAYTKIVPLTDIEISLLPNLIVARRVTTTMISQWRASLYPENIDYIIGDEARSRRKLELTASLSGEATRRRFRQACHP